MTGDETLNWQQWRDARTSWVSEGHNWPGGELVRQAEESAAYPGTPFDPADI